jgi:hypothetical protein
MLEVLGVKNAAKLVPMEDDFKPRDHESENMDMINGKPVKAFIYQDHQAHIAVHMAAAQDPKIAQLIGQSPNARTIQSALAAHIQEHLAFEYRKQIEEAAGVPYPAPDSEMSEETEVQISRLAAAAAQQVLQKNQASMAQEQAQQAAQDPIVQMQQAELQIKAQETEIKKQKLLIDTAAKKDQLAVERERIASQKEIAGMQTGAKIAADKANLSSKQQAEGMRMGIEIARELQQGSQPPVKENE